MNRSLRFLSVIVIGVALATPGAVGIHGYAAAQEKHEDKDKDHKDKRYYDEKGKDYHDWDESQDRAFRRYMKERHEDYRDFDRLNHEQQEAYWEWRHEHRD